MEFPTRLRAVGGIIAVFVAMAAVAVVGVALFYVIPASLADLLGIVLTLCLVAVVGRLALGGVRSALEDYSVAEVAVEGPISRDGRPGGVPGGPRGTPAADIVEQIERADDDSKVEALLLKLNTPGGEVVPSDDIRRAAADFDGPTIAYATDVCASGGYWIASGCDELWARDASIVGSIGVIGSRVNVAELADRLGVSYERFAAGDYKDAGISLREIESDERRYLQGLIDDFYEHFVERVAEGREMDPETIRTTEARVYLGDDAYRRGFVDALGARDEIETALEARLGHDIEVRAFEPKRGLADRLSIGARDVAYAFGAGIATRFDPDDAFDIRLR
ncbi:signal peptide peptidase SppA [Haloferacaceae archaeon DSL9]